MLSLTPLVPIDGVAADDGGAQRRANPRSNIFVVAALAAETGSGPVRIRNMSRSGALIEGAVIPPEGSTIRLNRGSLGVSGQIVWRRDNRAGVRFNSSVAVADWLPGGKRSSGQQRVDEIVYSYKAELSQARGGPTPPAPSGGDQPNIADELLELRSALYSVAEELAGDESAAERHPTALQTIDVAAQKLEKIAARLGSAGATAPTGRFR